MPGEIKVTVKVEGVVEREGRSMQVAQGTTVLELVHLLAAAEPQLKRFMFDAVTGELGVFMVAVNGEMCRLASGGGRVLHHGDEVWILSPIGGG